MSLTESQQDAIHAEGDVIVLAGAGTGKTRTMVARCLDRVFRTTMPVDIHRILMVTFTEAAASEMKERIRTALQEQRTHSTEPDRVEEQLALLDTAKIGTLHSVALELIREFCHDLKLSPRLRVLSSEESHRLAHSALAKVFEQHYEHRQTSSKEICSQIQQATQGNDRALRALVHRIHCYIQSLPRPDHWLQKQLERNQTADPHEWYGWITEALPAWINEWQGELQTHATACSNLQAGLEALTELASLLPAAATPPLPTEPITPLLKQIAARLHTVLATDQNWPKGLKTKHRKPLEPFFDELQFLTTLIMNPSESSAHPIEEDWDRCRNWNLRLLQLTQEFTSTYETQKTQLEALDFQDLEQWALKLLYSPDRNTLSPIASNIQERFDYVFVDEYQDINGAQDAIIRALSRQGPTSNLFIVGDIKQSIYRFRRANPEILKRYENEASRSTPPKTTVYLQSNFRSRPALLNFVNEFCSTLAADVEGFDYGEHARLLPGRRDDTAPKQGTAPGALPAVEFHLLVKDELPDTGLTAREAEVHVIAQRIRQLLDSKLLIEDEAEGPRPIQCSDIAILMRSMTDRPEIFVRVFAKYDIPVQATSGNFFDQPEIADLIALLKVIDNPLQDIPLLALLRSPFFGFKPNELAIIRLAMPKGYFWHALLAFNQDPMAVEKKLQSNPSREQQTLKQIIQETHLKSERAVENYEQWIRSRRTTSIATQIEEILAAGFYLEYVSSLSPSRNPRTQIRQLLELTRDYERQPDASLSHYLKWIDELRDSEHEIEALSEETTQAVQLMSIHKSKGLEFPVVILADLSKRINFSDLSQRLIIDEAFGLCPILHLPNTAETYPSLSHWLSQRKHRTQVIEEEARLLYVALTRAKEHLILIGHVTEKQITETWNTAPQKATERSAQAKSFMDWLGPWAHGRMLDRSASSNLAGEFFPDCIILQHRDLELPSARDDQQDPNTRAPSDLQPSSLAPINERLTWQYPYAGSIDQRAKGSISALEKLSRLELEVTPIASTTPVPAAEPFPRSSRQGIASGLAYHRALQFMRPSLGHKTDTATKELRRLESQGLLTQEDLDKINVESIVSFWSSETGQAIRSEADRMHRELPFTARFTIQELDALGFAVTQDPAVQSESVILQGVVDLAIIRESDIWILDFKSEAITRDQVTQRAVVHAEQLSVYSLALSRIYRRPVTQLWIHFLIPDLTVRLEPPKENGFGSS